MIGLDMDQAQFEEALRKVLHEKRVITDEELYAMYNFTKKLRDKLERRERFVEKFKQSFVGGIALLLLSGLVWVGTVILEKLHIG